MQHTKKPFFFNASLFITVAIFLAVAAYGYLELMYVQQTATMQLDAPNTVTVGAPQSIPIIIDTKQDTVNAAEVYITFDPTQAKIESVSKDKSFFTLWITDQPSFSNESGLITFAGGLPTPGFKGNGTVGSFMLTPLKKGRIVLTIDAKSRILKNDGHGTAVPLRLSQISFSAN